MGLKIGDLKRFTDPLHDTSSYQLPLGEVTPSTIDLENPSHLYLLFSHWAALEAGAQPLSNTQFLLETLKWYEEQTPLTPVRRTILYLKKYKVPNRKISKILLSTYGRTYADNYISTIYSKEICGKVAATVELKTNEWIGRHNPKLWKKCKKCGQTLYLHNRYWGKKNGTWREDCLECEANTPKV